MFMLVRLLLCLVLYAVFRRVCDPRGRVVCSVVRKLWQSWTLTCAFRTTRDGDVTGEFRVHGTRFNPMRSTLFL